MLTLAQSVMQRCDILARHSEQSDCLTRLYLSPPMKEVHRDLKSWMIAAGMTVRLDAAGNMVGRRPANAEGNTRVLLMGSHLDTVPNAGKYDGILGVLVSLAVVEALKENSLPFAIDVIGFSEEEGVRYSQPYLGSHAIAGSFETNWLDRLDESGIAMREAIARFGLDAKAIPDAAYDSEDVIGFLETHIEQGPILEEIGLPVGIVEAIVGQSRLSLRITGKAGHAGTTPMASRKDALAGAAQLVHAVQKIGRTTEGLRATVGRLNVSPNASNVIPSQVDLTLDIRHSMDRIRIAAVSDILAIGRDISIQEDLKLDIIHRSETPSVRAAAEFVDLMSHAIAARGLKSYTMSSGAGHDAVAMADRFPIGMLFVRHPEGISHHPDERVETSDVAVAIDVMVGLIQQLAKRESKE